MMSPMSTSMKGRGCGVLVAGCWALYLTGYSLDAGADEPITCKLGFDVTAEIAHGTVAAGDELHGDVTFTTSDVWQKNEARSFKAEGKMVLSHPDHGTVSGDVWVVHVSRTPYFVDYISVDARDAKGDLGGIEKYFDPMLVTVYTKGGGLTTFELPKQSRGWNALTSKRTFQVHTRTATQTFYGVVGRMEGQCLATGR